MHRQIAGLLVAGDLDPKLPAPQIAAAALGDAKVAPILAGVAGLDQFAGDRMHRVVARAMLEAGQRRQGFG